MLAGISIVSNGPDTNTTGIRILESFCSKLYCPINGSLLNGCASFV